MTRRWLWPQDGWLFLATLNVAAVVACLVLGIVGAIQQRLVVVALMGAALGGYFALLAIYTIKRYTDCYSRPLSTSTGNSNG